MNAVAAQVSLYPLRQERLGPVIEAAIDTFRRSGLMVLEGPMSTIVAGELEAVFAALQEAFALAAAQGEAVMVGPGPNGRPGPAPGGARGSSR